MQGCISQSLQGVSEPGTLIKNIKKNKVAKAEVPSCPSSADGCGGAALECRPTRLQSVTDLQPAVLVYPTCGSAAHSGMGQLQGTDPVPLPLRGHVQATRGSEDQAKHRVSPEYAQAGVRCHLASQKLSLGGPGGPNHSC